MKILHITNNFPTPNYPIFGIFIKEQIDSLTDLGIENEVFFMNSREGGKGAYLKALIKLQSHLRNNKYDIIHCHHSYSAVISVFSGKLTGQKCLLSYQSDPKNESGKLLFKMLYHYFDGIILKNKSAEIKYPKSIYLPNGVNTDFFVPMDKSICKKKLGLTDNKRYIVFMDSYNRRPFKRLDRFTKTLEILEKRHHVTDLEPLILTNTKRSLIPLYLCASELHLLTSDFEGSPNSVKECLACNIPVVSTPVGNVTDLLGDIEGCYISRSFEPEELASLVDKALKWKNFSSRASIQEKGLDLKTVAKNLLGVYHSIIKQN